MYSSRHPLSGACYGHLRIRCPDQPINCSSVQSVSSTPTRELARLRASRERPSRRRAAEKRDEVAAFHSTTSSARASSADGPSSLSAFLGGPEVDQRFSSAV
jgi:hypothetical protein